MSLSSMTGFACRHGASGAYVFERELKSVNAKELDFRIRSPSGWDDIELPVRKRSTKVLSRGTVFASFTVKRANAVSTVQDQSGCLDLAVEACQRDRGQGRHARTEDR